MAALQAQRLGGVGHALVVALEFAQDLLALEGAYVIGQRSVEAGGGALLGGYCEPGIR